MNTKTELMNCVAAGQLREIFQHSTEGWFDITGMREMISNNVIAANIVKIKCDFEVVKVELEQIIPFIFESRVMEQERVLSLSKESVMLDPGLVILTNDGKHLLIDGTHRAIARAIAGEKFMLFYMIPENRAIRPSPAEINSAKNHEWGDKTLNEKGEIVSL